MSQARCRRSALWWWGACGAWALAGPVMAADISQAREVAPPPGDRGELLYELPIAPVATSKPSAPPTVRSPAPVVSPASNAKVPLARDDSRTTAPGVPPGRTAARPVDKPAVGVVRRPASEAANTPSHTGRLVGTTEKRTPRLVEPPSRAAVRGARSADVPRETPARERPRAQVKPSVAEPVRPAQKGRAAGKALPKSEAAKTPMASRARPRTMSAEQSAARVAPEQASKKRVVTKTTVAKSASASKRGGPSTRAAAPAPQTLSPKGKAPTSRMAAPDTRRPGRAKALAPAARQASPLASKKARGVTAPRVAPSRAKTAAPAVKAKKIAPQKASRTSSR